VTYSSFLQQGDGLIHGITFGNPPQVDFHSRALEKHTALFFVQDDMVIVDQGQGCLGGLRTGLAET
jgi:hypothetical protein